MAAALIIETFFAWAWWHPYCNKQDDGPGAEAFGIPLPYGEPSLISSLEVQFLPHVYVLNIALLGLLVSPLFWLAFRQWQSKIVTVIGTVILGLLMIANAYWALQVYRPTTELMASWEVEGSYWDYRPTFLMEVGDNRCDRQ